MIEPAWFTSRLATGRLGREPDQEPGRIRECQRSRKNMAETALGPRNVKLLEVCAV